MLRRVLVVKRIKAVQTCNRARFITRLQSARRHTNLDIPRGGVDVRNVGCVRIRFAQSVRVMGM